MKTIFDRSRLAQHLTLLCSIMLMCFVTHSSSAYAQSPGASRFGFGLAVGTPVAVTGKYWTTDRQALDFGIGFGAPQSTMVYGDYLWHLPGIFGRSSKFVSQLTGYLGVGGGFASWSRAYCYRGYCSNLQDSGTTILVRVPFGLEWYPAQPPLGVFVELSALFSFGPYVWSTLDAMIGARFYF